VLLEAAEVEDTIGLVLVTKSDQSKQFEVVIVKVFLGVVVATRGIEPYPLTISVFCGIRTAQ
jgi:hypothetical protein